MTACPAEPSVDGVPCALCAADFKLTDMDEWPDSDEGDEDESGEDADDDEDKKKKKKRDVKGKADAGWAVQ